MDYAVLNNEHKLQLLNQRLGGLEEQHYTVATTLQLVESDSLSEQDQLQVAQLRHQLAQLEEAHSRVMDLIDKARAEAGVEQSTE